MNKTLTKFRLLHGVTPEMVGLFSKFFTEQGPLEIVPLLNKNPKELSQAYEAKFVIVRDKQLHLTQKGMDFVLTFLKLAKQTGELK